MRKRAICCFLFCLAASGYASDKTQDEIVMSNIIKAAKTQCEMAEQIECEFTFVDTFPEETYRKRMGLQTDEINGHISFVQFRNRFRKMQDPKWAGNIGGGPAYLSRQTSAFDGSLFRSLSESKRSGTPPQGTVASQVPEVEKADTPLSLMALRIGRGESLYDALTAGTAQVEYLGTRVQNGMAYEAISVKYEKGNALYELSFDPAHNFRLAEWRMTGLDGQLYAQASLEYPSDKEAPAFPSAVTVDGFRYRPGQSEPVLVRRLHLSTVKAEPLTEVSDQVFKITFPPGTKVYDQAVEGYYIVGAPSLAEEDVDDLIKTPAEVKPPEAGEGATPTPPEKAGEPREVERERQTAPTAQPAEPGRNIRLLLTGFGVGLVVVGILSILWRRRQKSKAVIRKKTG